MPWAAGENIFKSGHKVSMMSGLILAATCIKMEAYVT